MNVLKRSYEIAKLILKYHRDELSPEELKRLDEWRGKDKRNENTFLKYTHLSDMTEGIQFLEDTDLPAGWEHVQKKIGIRKNKFIRYIIGGSVAAGIVIIWSITTWLQLTVQPAKTSMMAVYMPDRNRVQLQLSNGEIILLSQASEVRESDGRNVAISDTASIVYIPSDTSHADKVKYNTIITPRGTEYVLTLSDGTKIWLNSESKLTFPIEFKGNSREVDLVGEGYFEVAKDPSHPFIVKSGGIEVKVTGTIFNIMAYPEEGFIRTTLVSGAVKVRCPSKLTWKEITLTPDHQATFWTLDKEVEHAKVDVTPYIAWHEGYICFNYESLGTISKRLERWYDIKFEFDDPAIKELIFYGKIKRHENILQVLDILKQMNLIDFIIEDTKTVRIIQI